MSKWSTSIVLGGFPPGRKWEESEWAISVDVSKYFNRSTGFKTMADLVITTNKGSESTEVCRPPDTLVDKTDTAAYWESTAYLSTEHDDNVATV